MASIAERRLAAILAADVVGYSRLIEADEAGTLGDLKVIRQKILEPLLAENRGRIVKLMGDGVIAEFGSIVTAVACAAAIQSQLATTQADTPPDRRIVLRIGVHLGDVVVEGEDLLGDGVNIAARLEQLCPPGAVLISGAAHEQLSGKLDLPFTDAGEQRLKNIVRPVRAFQLAPEGANDQLPPQPVQADKPAVAVLPFQNLSDDPDQVYFSDGITEDIITELSRFRELLVIARNSSFAFRGKSIDVREIGRALGASHVIEGNVRRAGDRVRINAQLVDASTGTHIWAERYDRALADVFAVQEEIAQSIVARVAQRVIDEREMAARRRPPQDLRAYDVFLRALRLGGTSFTPEVGVQLEALYQQVLAIDPTFARAYSGLAFIHVDRSWRVIAGVRSQPDEEMLLALDFGEKALALDPNDPRVQSTCGLMYAYGRRDFDRAERHFDLARSMNPNDAVVQILYASLQRMRGKPERGLAAVEIARRLNPRYPPWYNSSRAHLLFQRGDYDDAAALLETRMWDDPARYLRDLGWRVAANAHAGHLDQAARRGEELVREIGSHWQGDPRASASAYVDWVVWFSVLEQASDEEHLRAGLRLAGLPA
ncbi:adenylate class-3/4/guanylyl cyclase [Mesorhizobium sp. L-8-3]|nr:adenylate class-3/4/guanylyl cyclase [Mesorhizobium sp. L-8-3]